MKRLNPDTGLPFKSGDIREDGNIFASYQKTRILKSGFFKERWLSPLVWENSRQQGIKHYHSNKQKYTKLRSENRKNNLERENAYHKNYRAQNLAKIISENRARRLLVQNRMPKWLSKNQRKEISEFYKMAKELEKVFPWKQHVDHIVPLKGKTVSGLHVPWNLQILSVSENIKKRNNY